MINTELAILEFLTSFKLLSIHWEHFRAVACVVAAFFTLLMTSVKAQSQTVPPPAVVKLPAGLNLGGTIVRRKSDIDDVFCELHLPHH